MGLLERAEQLAKSTLEYLTGTTTGKTGSAGETSGVENSGKVNKSPNSVCNPDGKCIGGVGDAVVKSKNVVVTKEMIDNKINELTNKCEKFGITYQEAKEKIFKGMDFSIEEFNALSLEQQMNVLNNIDDVLSLFIYQKKHSKFSDDVDMSALLGMVTQNYAEAKEAGLVNSLSEYIKLTGDINKEIYKRYKNAATDEEKAQIILEAENAVRARLAELEKQELQACSTDADRSKINKKYKGAIKIVGKQRQIDHLRMWGKEEARNSIYFRTGEEFDDAIAVELNAFKPEFRAYVADANKHEFLMTALKKFHENGDDISAATYGTGVKYLMQGKTFEAAEQFEADAYEFRIKYENGEIDAPWITSEHFQAESVAIAVGATNNVNMSSEEKAAFLNTWDKHAQNFDDYYDVKYAYNESVKNNTNPTNTFNDVKVILKEQYNNDIQHLPRAWLKRNDKNYDVDENETTVKIKASESTLISELQKKTVSEVKQNYANSMHEFAKVVLHNDKRLCNRIKDILPYLEGKSGKDIGIMLADAGCSTPTISAIISAFPDKKDDILDIVTPYVCYAGRKQLECA